MKKGNITIRVTETQKERLQSLASEAGVSLTDFILSKALELPLVSREKVYYTPKKKKVDWREDERQYREAVEMSESLEVALWRSNVE